VIEGSPGLGKTRLLAEARSLAHSAGMNVLAARGGELEGIFAYGVVHQLFEPLLARADPDVRAELLSGSAGLAAPLFDPSQLALARNTSGERSFAILHGLYWLLANLAFRGPTLLAVDDLHWVDPPSLRWLAYASRRLAALPLLVIAGTRPLEAQGNEPGVAAELLTDPGAITIRPTPLGTRSIATLAREEHGLELDDAFCCALQTATGGNPLFIGAMLEAVVEGGLDPTRDNAGRLTELGARGIERSIRRRLAHLPANAVGLLRAAAILGDGLPLRDVGALANLEGSALGEASLALVRADLLRRAEPVEFAHPVIRSAVYQMLDFVERGVGHRRAADLLSDAGALPESVAAHLVLSPPGSDPSVVSTLREAADRSLLHGASDAAVRYLERALEERCELSRADTLVELGLAERRTNGPASVDHLRTGLELLSDPARRGRIALELGRALWFSGLMPEALAVFERALEEIDRDRDADLHELLVAELIGSAWWGPDTYPIAESWIGRIDLDSLHGGAGSDLLLATLAHHEYRLGSDRERALDLARRALASGRLSTSGAVAFSYAALALPASGALDEGLALYDDALTQARRRGDIFHVASMLMWRGKCQTMRGDLPAALTDLREASRLSAEHGVEVSRPYNLAFLVDALLDRGEVEEATRVMSETGVPERPPANLHLVFFRLVRGRLRVESGAPEPGVEELLAHGQLVRMVPFDNPALVPWRRYAAEGLRMLDRDDEARALVEEELALARRWGAPQAVGAALRALGLLTGGQEGEQHLREAVATLAGSQARVEQARALVDLGAALRRANRRKEAREQLRKGVQVAHAAGAIGLAERANEEIAATGARPRKVLQTGINALTASERRAAQMAAEGMSNKEIAQTLFVTVKTVEVHLSGVYRKLEISSRSQLDTALAAAAPTSATGPSS
jgi:DNA-binding CsgD family transcriptional regulator